MFKPGDTVKVNKNYPWHFYYPFPTTLVEYDGLFWTTSNGQLFKEDELDLV